MASLFADGLALAVHQPEIMTVEFAAALLIAHQGRQNATDLLLALAAGLLGGIAVAGIVTINPAGFVAGITLAVALPVILARKLSMAFGFVALSMTGLGIALAIIADNNGLIPPAPAITGLLIGIMLFVTLSSLVAMAVRAITTQETGDIALRVAASWCAAIALLIGAFALTG